MDRLTSFVGIFILLAMAWVIGGSRRRPDARIVLGGLGLQAVLALLLLKTSAGLAAFEWAGDLVKKALELIQIGTNTMIGEDLGLTLAGIILPTIIFFSALMALLYHWGLVQPVVRGLGWLMERSLGTSGAESLAAAANVFVGQTEAPLVVRPYLESMTRSELASLMVGGFATIAGGVLAAYVGMNIDASHLLTASVLSAPAALLVAKVMVPETEVPATRGSVDVTFERDSVNALDALAKGTTVGVRLALNVGAMLFVFTVLIAILNAGLAWFDEAWSVERFLGYLFFPFAWLMGVEWKDCLPVGELIGIKTAANEFVAYGHLRDWAAPDSPVVISERSRTIATYALCGFANFSSIGIQLGGIGALAPGRQGDLARLGLRAMIGGAIAAMITACFAGMLL